MNGNDGKLVVTVLGVEIEVLVQDSVLVLLLDSLYPACVDL